jgi:hypothetical protein
LRRVLTRHNVSVVYERRACILNTDDSYTSVFVKLVQVQLQHRSTVSLFYVHPNDTRVSGLRGLDPLHLPAFVLKSFARCVAGVGN